MNDGIRTLTEQDINAVSSSKQVQYGAQGMTEDGRFFRYCAFGGTTTIVPGVLVQSPAVTANFQGMTITASGTSTQVAGNLATGATQLVVSNTTSSTANADNFAEGFIDILIGGTAGTASYTYRVKGNTAVTAGNVTTSYFTVYLAEALRNTTALVPGTDVVNLRVSPYNGVNITTTVNVPIGVTVMPVVNTATVTNYGWVQTKGTCVALNDASTTVAGNTVGPSTTTSGYVGLSVAQTKPAIGWSVAGNSGSAGSYPIHLNIQ